MEPITDKKAPQKTSVSNQIGDFLIIGKKDESQVLVIPSLQMNQKSQHMFGEAQGETTAFVMTQSQSVHTKAKVQSSSQEGLINVGMIHQHQAFLNMYFSAKKAQ